MLPVFFGFKGNDLLLIFKLQSPAGGGQLPEPSPFSALPPSVPAANNPLYRPATPLLRHTLYKLQQRFFYTLFSRLPLFGHVSSPRIGVIFCPNSPLSNLQERAIVWRKNSFCQPVKSENQEVKEQCRLKLSRLPYKGPRESCSLLGWVKRVESVY